jgi:hypothetical protein
MCLNAQAGRQYPPAIRARQLRELGRGVRLLRRRQGQGGAQAHSAGNAAALAAGRGVRRQLVHAVELVVEGAQHVEAHPGKRGDEQQGDGAKAAGWGRECRGKMIARSIRCDDREA